MKLRRISARDLYFIALGITSTMYIVSIRGIPLFYYLAVVGIFLIRKVSFRFDKEYLLFITISLISLLVNFTNGYETTMALSFFLSSVVCLLCMSILTQRTRTFDNIVLGIKISCLIQIVWCFLQFGLFRIAGLDINKIVFENLLHTTSTASRIIDGQLILTGLCWHPSNMVPVLILSIVLFRNRYIWAACILISLGMNSSTAILALLTLVATTLFRSMMQRQLLSKLKTRKAVVGIAVALLLAGLVLGFTNVGNSAVESVLRLVGRVTGINETSSTSVHRSYYSLLPQILEKTPVLKILFGYGPGCSGLAITQVNGQYGQLGAWVVESDYMNILYSYGFVGFAVYYAWLIKKLFVNAQNRNFFIDFLTPLLIAGITYNVQYYWVVFVIIIFSAYGYSENRRSEANEILQQ